MNPFPVSPALATVALLFSVMSAAVPAGPSESIHVRALDTQLGIVVAEQWVALDSPLALEVDGQAQYLSLQSGQFRGQEVLEISLSQSPDDRQQASFTPWHLPHRQGYGDRLVLELTPEDWAERFCDGLNTLPETDMRDAELGLRVDEHARFLNEPGWDGGSPVALVELGGDGSPGIWSARVDDEQLILVGPDWNGSMIVEELRRDFPMIRVIETEGRSLQIDFIPAGYPQAFCEAWAANGPDHAGLVVDYFFGRAVD